MGRITGTGFPPTDRSSYRPATSVGVIGACNWPEQPQSKRAPMKHWPWTNRLIAPISSRYLTTCASAAGRAAAAANHQRERYRAAEALTPRQQQALVRPRYRAARLKMSSQEPSAATDRNCVGRLFAGLGAQMEIFRVSP